MQRAVRRSHAPASAVGRCGLRCVGGRGSPGEGWSWGCTADSFRGSPGRLLHSLGKARGNVCHICRGGGPTAVLVHATAPTQPWQACQRSNNTRLERQRFGSAQEDQVCPPCCVQETVCPASVPRVQHLPGRGLTAECHETRCRKMKNRLSHYTACTPAPGKPCLTPCEDECVTEWDSLE